MNVPPPPPEKWNARLTASLSKKSAYDVTQTKLLKHATQIIEESKVSHVHKSQAGCMETIIHEVDATKLLKHATQIIDEIKAGHINDHQVETVMQRAFTQQAHNAIRLHDSATMAKRINTQASPAFGQALLQLASMEYVEERCGTLHPTERCRIQTALLSTSAIERYTQHLDLKTRVPTSEPLTIFLAALHNDQRQGAEVVQATLPISTTKPGSPLYTLFCQFSPQAQAYASVSAFVAATLDACWCSFWGVTEIGAEELRSLATTNGGDHVKVLEQYFLKRYNARPLYTFGFSSECMHSCTVSHLDGTALASALGNTRECAQRQACEDAMASLLE